MSDLKWIPFKDLLFLQERMGRVFDEALAKYMGENVGAAWMPPADIYESSERITIKIELPGLTIDEIDVTLDDNNLIVKGERKLKKNFSADRYQRMECPHGLFQRILCLPCGVESDSIKASLKDGILEVIVQKTAEEKHKHLKVEVK